MSLVTSPRALMRPLRTIHVKCSWAVIAGLRLRASRASFAISSGVGFKFLIPPYLAETRPGCSRVPHGDLDVAFAREPRPGVCGRSFEERTPHGVVLNPFFLEFGQAVVDDVAVEVPPLALVSAILWKGPPFGCEGARHPFVGFGEQRGYSLIEEIEATAKLNVGSYDRRALLSVLLPCPPERSLRGKFPEVYAVAEPIPLILARFSIR
jgi:hypothetical protein